LLILCSVALRGAPASAESSPTQIPPKRAARAYTRVGVAVRIELEGSAAAGGVSAKTEDPRIVALRVRERTAKLKPWAKPAIIADEPRDFYEFPLRETEAA
jgi:hypothetical protein